MEVKARRTKRNLLLKKGDHTRSVETILSRAPRSKMPQRLVPMLATLVDRPFDEPGWVYEVKWDGYRALAFCNGMDVNLLSRNEKSFNDKFYPLIEELEKWDVRAVVDGEVVVLDENGVSSFGALQNWRSEADGELVFYVFDVLWYDGKDLLGVRS